MQALVNRAEQEIGSISSVSYTVMQSECNNFNETFKFIANLENNLLEINIGLGDGPEIDTTLKQGNRSNFSSKL